MRAKYGFCPFQYHTTPCIPSDATIGGQVVRRVNGGTPDKHRRNHGDWSPHGRWCSKPLRLPGRLRARPGELKASQTLAGPRLLNKVHGLV